MNNVKGNMLVLKPESFQNYVESFNKNDDEKIVNFVDNKSAWGWLEQNIPFFESSDKGLEEMYYFRWWTFRKHIKKNPDGFVITEFLHDVPWGGKYNTINCAAAHHFCEGRWLRDRQYLKDYAYFWFRKGGEPRRYSFPAADAIRSWAMVTHDQQLAIELYPALLANYREWEKSNQDPNGLFWQNDGNDGMEVSIGGHGYRPTINSYMYGETLAMSEIAKWARTASESVTNSAMADANMESDLGWKPEHSMEFAMKAAQLRELVEDRLWDERFGFYKTLSRGENQWLVDVRELLGYVPWCFNLPKPGREEAWKQLMDPQGFYAPFGPTTAERRHPRFMFQNPHECLWNGPSWPFATSQTLTAMANLLNNYKQHYVTKNDYLEMLRIYARSQHLKQADGTVIPFIDENLNPDTGEWIARDILLHKFTPEQLKGKGDKNRGRDYNHSTFNDLIISGLVGLRPRIDHAVEVNPLVPEDAMDYFCMDGVRYHDCNLTILWDKSGERYHKGKGLHVFANGQEIASAPRLQWVAANLPQTNAGWKKYENNPVIDGGKLGGLMDVTVLQEDGKYRMFGTLWHKQHIAVFESTDGIHWSEPEMLFGPNPASGWEDGVNRQMVVKKDDGYHMWYMGSAKGKAYIGYATSPDSKTWKRMSDKPVISPDHPWEKIAVMCPHVIWDEETKLFRMWYSGGGIYEPDAIGYATSPDGLNWTKHPANPIFRPDKKNLWEQERVAGCQVIRRDDWHYIFYIGYRDIEHAQIGMARSRDGITNWQRHPGNPMIRPAQDGFDKQACYKPFAVFDGKQWLLWYNGGRGWLEKIALVLREGEDFGF